MEVTTLTSSEWNGALPEEGFEVFHTAEALAVLDEHTPGELRLYGGFKGAHPVALLPVFVNHHAVGRSIFSPPPGRGVPHLGPVLMPNSPKRGKRESINRRFSEDVLDALDVDSSLSVFRLVGSPTYADPRPFGWSDLDVLPRFTYRIDVGSRSLEDVLASFDGSTRYEIRRGRDLDLSIEDEGVDGARLVYDDVAARYDEQGKAFPLTWSFVRDLVSDLDERCRVYVARGAADEYLTGIIALFSNGTAYNWQGGVATTYEGVSVPTVLHWAIIEDVAAGVPFDSLRWYDLVGANTPRLCAYKSKFGGELAPYYVVESAGTGMELAKRAYGLVKQ